MGTVYRATDQLLGRTVAIKFLKDSRTEEEAKKIRVEAQILARLVHDRIVRLYDFGESEGNHFLVMEEVNGPSFANRWQDLHLDDRLRICGQVAEALHYAHLQGVIHRDVKPSNVLLTTGDEAKLSDFGLSQVVGDRRDRSGRIEGTPLYMSPEQAQGLSLDHRTDLYSVGVMLYECATGEVPFAGDMRSVLGQHQSAAPTPPRFRNPEIWTTLDNLILSLLAKNPIQRPASGNVVALELFEEAGRAQRLRTDQPRGPGERDPPSPVDPPPSRTRTVGRPRSRANPGERDRANRTLNSSCRQRRRPRPRRFSGTRTPRGRHRPLPKIPPGRPGPAARAAARGARPPGRQPDARGDAGPAGRPLHRRALSLRSLPGVPPRRRAAGGDPPQTTARRPERRPRAAPAGDGLAGHASGRPTRRSSAQAYCWTSAPTSALRSPPLWWSSTWPAAGAPPRTNGSARSASGSRKPASTRASRCSTPRACSTPE